MASATSAGTSSYRSASYLEADDDWTVGGDSWAQHVADAVRQAVETSHAKWALVTLGGYLATSAVSVIALLYRLHSLPPLLSSSQPDLCVCPVPPF